MTDKLPDKPSELLQLALDDLAKVERSLDYEVDMENWHTPPEGGVCHVCMAGAVMAKTLKVDRFKGYTPHNFETGTRKKLRALDIFRTGNLIRALDVLEIDHSRFIALRIGVTDYHEDRTQFKEDMRDIIEALEREGL